MKGELPPLKRCVEPVKRMVGGRFGWAVHRFPIKGGVTVSVMWSEALASAAYRPSPLAALMRTKP